MDNYFNGLIDKKRSAIYIAMYCYLVIVQNHIPLVKSKFN